MGLTSAKYRGCNCLSANGGVRKPLQGQSADVVDGKRRLLVVSRGCWWQAEVVGGKQRLLVASGGCWWQAEVVGGKPRLLVASGGCWWQAGQAEVVESSFVKENNEVSALSHAVWRLSKGFHCSPTGNIDAFPKCFDAEFFAENQMAEEALGVDGSPYLR